MTKIPRYDKLPEVMPHKTPLGMLWVIAVYCAVDPKEASVLYDEMVDWYMSPTQSVASCPLAMRPQEAPDDTPAP